MQVCTFFFYFHLTIHRANQFLLWHILYGEDGGLSKQTWPCLPARSFPEVTRTPIKLAGIAWGWGTSKGWVGQGIAPEERAGVIIHSQCSWGSTWREEGFGPRWNPREGGFNGRWHRSQALWPGDAGDKERSSRLSVPSVPASTTCYFATSCVTQRGTCTAAEGS